MTIQLIKAHTHAGRKYPPGAVLTLRDDKAQWLIGLGIAESAPADASKSKEAAK